MGYIETGVWSVNIVRPVAINSNMGCIETVKRLVKKSSRFWINSNMGNIETPLRGTLASQCID